MISKIYSMKRFLLALFFLFSGSALFACECTLGPVTEKSVEPFDFIFAGKVVAVSGCDETAKVKFTVSELYRGKSYATTELEFDCSSDCQMSFAPDEEWLIYAHYTGYGQAKVEFCSYSRKKFANPADDFNTVTHQMDFATEQAWLKHKFGVQKLNEYEIVEQQHHENLKPQGLSMLWVMLAGFGVLGLFYFIVRKFLR